MLESSIFIVYFGAIKLSSKLNRAKVIKYLVYLYFEGASGVDTGVARGVAIGDSC